MWRTSLADGKGMLFIFAQQQYLSFWMRNTLIPLDMIFIAADRRIAGIMENAEPETETSRRISSESRFVLELNGGSAARLRLEPGQPVDFQGFSP